jgi:hypothetical protein
MKFEKVLLNVGFAVRVRSINIFFKFLYSYNTLIYSFNPKLLESFSKSLIM